MKKYEFTLNKGYCYKKGIAVLKQNGSFITFLISNLDDEVTKQKVRNAFCSYLSFVRKQKDCENEFKKVARVEFVGGSVSNFLKG